MQFSVHQQLSQLTTFQSMNFPVQTTDRRLFSMHFDPNPCGVWCL